MRYEKRALHGPCTASCVAPRVMCETIIPDESGEESLRERELEALNLFRHRKRSRLELAAIRLDVRLRVSGLA